MHLFFCLFLQARYRQYFEEDLDPSNDEAMIPMETQVLMQEVLTDGMAFCSLMWWSRFMFSQQPSPSQKRKESLTMKKKSKKMWWAAFTSMIVMVMMMPLQTTLLKILLLVLLWFYHLSTNPLPKRLSSSNIAPIVQLLQFIDVRHLSAASICCANNEDY